MTETTPTAYEFDELREYALFLEAVIADKDRELEKQKKEIVTLQERGTTNERIIRLENALHEEQEECALQKEIAEQHRQTSLSLTAFLDKVRVRYGIHQDLLLMENPDDTVDPSLQPSPPLSPRRKSRQAPGVKLSKPHISGTSAAPSPNTSFTSNRSRRSPTRRTASSRRATTTPRNVKNDGVSPSKKPFTTPIYFPHPIEQGML